MCIDAGAGSTELASCSASLAANGWLVTSACPALRVSHMECIRRTPILSPPCRPTCLPDPQIYNNLITDIDMTALRLLGCHDCLVAHNTMIRVGSHPDYSSAILVDYGSSQCDVSGVLGAGAPVCCGLRRAAHHAGTMWGWAAGVGCV